MATDNVLTLTSVEDTARALIEICMQRVRGVIHLVAPTPIVRSQLADLIIAGSRFGAAMTYTPVKYADLSFDEYRPRQAWLKVTGVSGPFCRDFEAPQFVISRKLGVLDANRECNPLYQ